MHNKIKIYNKLKNKEERIDLLWIYLNLFLMIMMIEYNIYIKCNKLLY